MKPNIHISFCIFNINDSNDLLPGEKKFFITYIKNFTDTLEHNYDYTLTNIEIKFNKAINVYGYMEQKEVGDFENLDDLIDMLSKEQQKLQYNGKEYTIKKIKMINRRNINISFFIYNINTNGDVNTNRLSGYAKDIFKKYIETVFVPGLKELEFEISLHNINFNVNSIDLNVSTYNSNPTSLSSILSMLNEKIIENIIFSNGQNYVNSRKEQYKFKEVKLIELLPSCPDLFN
jgi:hypothetical protein